MREPQQKAAPTVPHEPRWRRRKDDRPREIMDAAMELFLEKGFAATRLEDIAAKANVTKGTLFIYFTNKEDLFKSLVRDGINQMAEFREANNFNIRVSSQDSLLFVINNWWKFLANSDFGKLPKLIVTEAVNFPDIASLYIDEVLTPGRALVRDIIQQGMEKGEFRPLDPDQAARAVLAPLLMLLVWRHSGARFEKNPMDDLEYVNTVINITLNGLLVHPK